MRVTFVLVRYHGMKYAEAARILEVPEGTVKSRIAKAAALIKERIEGRLDDRLDGMESPGADRHG